MKKLFSKLTAFCLGLLVSISIYACADDFKDPSLMGSEELQSLKELVAKYHEDVTKLTENVSKLSDEVSTLKTTVEQQDAKIAELSEKVEILRKRDLLSKIRATYIDGGETYTDTCSFEYNSEGRITNINGITVSYTNTGCVLSKTNGYTIEFTTTSNDIAAINRLLWARFSGF